jgi:hypothetical protein
LPPLQEDPGIRDGSLHLVGQGQVIQAPEHEQARCWRAIALILDSVWRSESFVDQEQEILDVGPSYLPVANFFCKRYRCGISEPAYLPFTFRVVGVLRNLGQCPVNYELGIGRFNVFAPSKGWRREQSGDKKHTPHAIRVLSAAQE